MDRLLFFFITSTLSSLLWPALLPAWSLPALLICVFVCLFKHWLAACGCFAGVLWMSSVGYWLMLTQPDESLFSQRIWITGQVVSVVTGFDEGKFDFVTEKVSLQKNDNWQVQSHKVRLSWRAAEIALAQGQRLQLEVKLKPRWGLANEAGFDYQQWQFSKNIVASGYVVKSEHNRLLQDRKTLRQTLANRLVSLDIPEIRWLLALGIGYRSGLTDTDWQLLQATGTSHLVAISGMHLGMVALWSYVFFVILLGIIRGGVDLLPGVSGRFLPGDIRTAALTATLLPCCIYASLAGYSVPTLRALAMLFLAWSLLKFNINWRSPRFIMVSVACFLLAFPLSIFSMSFWLSFGAIVMIAFILWRFPFHKHSNTRQFDFSLRGLVGKVAYFVKLQLGVTLLMIPLVILLFGGTSLVSPLVNLAAVPAVTLVLLPLSLLAMVLLLLDSGLAFDVLNVLLRLFFEAEQFLIRASGVWFSWFDIGVADSVSIFLAALGLLLMLTPYTLLPKCLYLVLVIPLATSLQQPHKRHWQLDVLDVGQGLSILLRKEGHALLYDTGAAYPSGFNMAGAVILPVLKKSNISYLDKLIISHDDNDHAGGLGILMAVLPVADHLHAPTTCHKDADFTWRGLQFDILWPHLDYVQWQKSDNNLSCVIKIFDGKHSVLLAGDIEYSVERILVDLHRQQRLDLRSDYLVAPHHGSKTSSTASFISAVSPQYAFVSAGFRNRWRMPAEEVLARYNNAGVTVFNTAEAGQISLIVKEEQPPDVLGWRINQHLRWYLRPLQE